MSGPNVWDDLVIGAPATIAAVAALIRSVRNGRTAERVEAKLGNGNDTVTELLTVIKELLKANTEAVTKLTAIDTYLHTKMHEINNHLSSLALADAALSGTVHDLVKQAKQRRRTDSS